VIHQNKKKNNLEDCIMYNIDLANVKSIVADIVAKHNVENVAFVGCGASKAELYPAKYFLANCSKKLRVAHYTANEFNYDTPDWLGDTTVVITASLGGSTPETVKANSVAKAAGATVVSVTHAAGSALTKEADYTIVHGFEANYAAKLEGEDGLRSGTGCGDPAAGGRLRQVRQDDRGPDQRVRGCRERCQLCPQVCQGVR